jgi:hypothetical protein
VGREEVLMQYRGYVLREDDESVKIETLHGTVISEGADHEAAQKIVDDWMEAP